MLKKLLNAGARGPVVDRALLFAVQDARDQDVRLLRHSGARVDPDGAALVEAIKAERPGTLSVLLEVATEITSLQRAFPALRSASKDVRLEMTEILLDMGVRGDAVSAALSWQYVISPRDEMRD